MTRTLYTITAHNGFEFHLQGPGIGRCRGMMVTDCDCSFCGDVGVHAGRLCDHQIDLMNATVHYIASELPLPFDPASDAEFNRWRKSLFALQEAAELR